MAESFDEDIKIEFKLVQNTKNAEALLLTQVHGADGYLRTILDLKNRERPKADWHWTTDRNIMLGILVADCTAILISGETQDRERFIAGIHAGWRGTAAGIIENFYERVNPKNGWKAWLSPSICKNHFEVGEEVLLALGENKSLHTKSKNEGKYLFDLKQNQIDRIKARGGEVMIDSRCTYCESEYVSYRQSGPNLNARQLAIISLVAKSR